MKKLSQLLLVLFMSFALVSCGNGARQENAGSAASEIASDSRGSTSELSAALESGTESQEAAEGSGENDPEENQTEEVQHGEIPSGEVEPDEGTLEDEGDEEKNLPEDGTYTTKDDVALYIYLYGCLPSNFITKKDAEKLGWEGGSLEPYAPGKCIGGSRFGNYEGLLPEAEGRVYTECDIDTLGAQKRGAKRIVFSNDGLIYYTEDHYESFELLYGEE